MSYSPRLHRFSHLSGIFALSAASVLSLSPALAQQPTTQQPTKVHNPGKQTTLPQPPAPVKPPALIDPAGPAVSLQSSEAMFDIAVALNACGYDDGLAESDPVRMRVRDQVNQATQQSAEAREDRDKLCSFIDQHRLANSGRDLAQYVSLGLYLTAPPDLTPSVDLEDMPPEATQVVEIAPLLRAFAHSAELHVIWVENRPAYDEIENKLHDPLTRMIVETNVYLKMPASSYDDRRFLVVVEPLLTPGSTNARVYGPDYVVITSPANGSIRMQDVRHTYLHYEIEPLLYARASSLDRLLPVLKAVSDAPLDFVYRSDIVALVIECMIRAIEARTMDTGFQEFKIPPNVPRSELESYDRQRNASLQKIAAVRQESVNQSMAQGYVLTQYFYDQLIPFERTPVSLKESIGEMVYGMEVDAQIHRARQVQFVQQGSSDVVRHAPRQLRGLDLAEMELMKGDAAGAGLLAKQAIDQKTPEPDRANFILARVDLMNGKIDDAESAFRETVRLSKDPRMLAWSHIYLGRILDVQDERDNAVTEYKAALTVRDGQPDTKSAAEKGIKQPFALPHHEQSSDDDGSDGASSTAKQPAASGTPPPQPK
jgi:hypothetical protein